MAPREVGRAWCESHSGRYGEIWGDMGRSRTSRTSPLASSLSNRNGTQPATPDEDGGMRKLGADLGAR